MKYPLYAVRKEVQLVTAKRPNCPKEVSNVFYIYCVVDDVTNKAAYTCTRGRERKGGCHCQPAVLKW